MLNNGFFYPETVVLISSFGENLPNGKLSLFWGKELCILFDCFLFYPCEMSFGCFVDHSRSLYAGFQAIPTSSLHMIPWSEFANNDLIRFPHLQDQLSAYIDRAEIELFYWRALLHASSTPKYMLNTFNKYFFFYLSFKAD